MNSHVRHLSVLGLAFSFATSLCADQPVFNEMPRWNDGWGVQLVLEDRIEKDLLDGSSVVGPGFTEEVEILHLEGVYTWARAIRLTAKLPYVRDARREQLVEGRKVVQHSSGIGDLTLALPLKRYFNLDGRSGSWTLAPQMIVPLDSEEEYSIYDHEWGAGISLGYETETYHYIYGVGVSAWHYFGKEPVEVKGSLSAGLNLHAFGSSGHIKLSASIHHEEDNSLTISTGPTLYWRFTDLLHGQVMWRDDVDDRQGTLDHGNGESLKAGLALVF